MKLLRRQFLRLAAGAATSPFVSRHASAQAYPSKPITLVVGFAAGGATDVMARILGEHMSRTLGQRIVVENVVGAGGTTATARVMRAAPDGYTITLGTLGTHVAPVALYPRLAYNPETDFAPIGVAGAPAIIVVGRKGLPPNGASELASYLKANSDKLNLAHAGVGSVTHFTCLLFNALLGAKPTQIPFGGAAPAMNAILAGQVDYMCVTTPDALQHIRSETVKAYMVGSPTRSELLPNVPTSQEVGLPEFQVWLWNGLFAPKETPKPVLDTLMLALDKAIDDETTRRRMTDIGVEMPVKAQRGPEALAAMLKDDMARFIPVLKAADIRMQ
jgi:tripartite-type tricarboxylate transporter receptor subunit TctC